MISGLLCYFNLGLCIGATKLLLMIFDCMASLTVGYSIVSLEMLLFSLNFIGFLSSYEVGDIGIVFVLTNLVGRLEEVCWE